MTISPKRLEELENIPGSAIDTSDIPELDPTFRRYSIGFNFKRI
ncbi:hypothetical protein QT971_02075 [Microcoleus sp. herbarium19]